MSSVQFSLHNFTQFMLMSCFLKACATFREGRKEHRKSQDAYYIFKEEKAHDDCCSIRGIGRTVCGGVAEPGSDHSGKGCSS